MSSVLGISVNCLFVGAGAIAEEYASGLASSPLSLAGACDLEAARADALAAEHDCRSFTDLETALAAVDAPIVVNLTSHAAHATVTRTALDANRHVYSQKPLALDAETAADLLATARRKGLALGCAPETPQAPLQRRASRLLADGRLGPTRLGYAYAHVGRVTDWHDRPDSFLEIGPLYDGAVYPLTLLVSWFGPVEEIRVADSLDIWPDRAERSPSAPSHVEATLSFAGGPVVRLTASFYAPHRSREFYGLELHGDDGSLSLQNVGAMDDVAGSLQFGGVGRSYTTVPPQSPTTDTQYLDAVERLAASVNAGKPSRASGRRGVHVVEICNAIERAATDGSPANVADHGVTRDQSVPPVVTPPDRSTARQSPRLPPVGFGCSRYRGGEYVDRLKSIATALDAGYRFLDSAELYGNEHRIGELLAAPGTPNRDQLFVLGKVWRTNHRQEHLLQACAGSLDELGIDAFDCYTLHWPEAWVHQGELSRLAEQPVEQQEALTFPETDDGDIATADLSLEQAWENLEVVADRGWARSLGICNVSRSQLETILDTGGIDPALVQIERHPYEPQTDLVEFCHERGIRVVAHSPLSAPGLLSEPVLGEIGDAYDLSAAGVVVAWNVSQGVVPIPSSTMPAHIVENLRAASVRLTAEDCDRIATLEDPDFER